MEFCIKITEPNEGLFIVAKSKHIKRGIQASRKKFSRSHVNRKELKTQLALIEHFETVYSQTMYQDYRTQIELFNDHWSSTWYSFLKLLEQDKAYILDLFYSVL